MKTNSTTAAPNFLQDWEPFYKLNQRMKNKILKLFSTCKYQYQTKHSEARKQFKPVSFSQIDNLLGLAYTSSGTFAGLWICNGVNVWADETRRFYGFAISTEGKFYALAEDENEQNPLFIEM